MARLAQFGHWVRGLALLAGLLLNVPAFAQGTAAPKVQFQTSLGNFTVEMDPGHAPVTVANFLRYVREGHYDGVIFHRVVPGFVIQGGGFDTQGKERDTHDPIPLETATATSNTRGTIAMARTQIPDSATAQFFINLTDNLQLDRQPGDPGNRSGYTVFGHVIDGMQVVDAIAMQPLGGSLGPSPEASPRTPVVIQRATIVN